MNARQRHSKIIATLCPSSSVREVTPEQALAGLDDSRLNKSLGKEADKVAVHAHIREIQNKRQRPMYILADLPGVERHAAITRGFRPDLTIVIGGRTVMDHRKSLASLIPVPNSAMRYAELVGGRSAAGHGLFAGQAASRSRERKTLIGHITSRMRIIKESGSLAFYEQGADQVRNM